MLNSALVKADETVTWSAKDTLVFDLCRTELYAAAHREKGTAAGAADRLEEALILLQSSEGSEALKQEREALVVEALKRTGRLAEAQERARSFVRENPNSPLRPRVEESVSGR